MKKMIHTFLTTHTTRRAVSLGASALALLLVVSDASDAPMLVLGGGDAHAVVGRPLTPMSYAGVARRTSRRTTRRSLYYGGAYGGYGAYGAYGAAAVSPGYITTLPAGCAVVGGIYQCGAARYRPYYNGPTLVYAPI